MMKYNSIVGISHRNHNSNNSHSHRNCDCNSHGHSHSNRNRKGSSRSNLFSPLWHMFNRLLIPVH